VSRAQVRAEGQITGKIGLGLLVLLGVGREDRSPEADRLLDKILDLRIFEDPGGKMNLSLLEAGGELMVVSQFTLYADCRRGRRPSFAAAGPAEEAQKLYEHFVRAAEGRGVKVASGVFRASMEVELINMGPVTILLDSSKDFW
jgi:D-tyrosyl-tRNA(Tyr) deacylase